MGVEKQLVSSKMRAENVDFLMWLSSQVEPYEVSLSSLIDLCVSIVRALFIKGEIALGPAALQVLLRQTGLPRLNRNGYVVVGESGPKSTPSEKGFQARFDFVSRRTAVQVVGMASRTSFPLNSTRFGWRAA